MTEAIVPQFTARFDEADHFRGITKMVYAAHGVCHGKN